MRNTTVLILIILCFGTITLGQIQPQEVSRRMTSNFKQLREYSWNTSIEVRVKGKQISETLEKFRYDIDGKLQIIPIGGTGKLSPELQPVITGLAELGLEYVQPDPQKFADFFSRTEIWQGKGGTVRIEGENFLSAGDYIDLYARNNRAERVGVQTLYGSETAVEINAEFRLLSDEGPNYVARLDISAPGEGIEVLIENFDFVRNAPLAASDVSKILPGTELRVRITAPLSSKQAKAGQQIPAVLDSDLAIEGVTVLKAGTVVACEVVAVKGAGRAQSKGNISIRTEINQGRE